MPTQLEACRKYAEQHGFVVVAELADDCSGTIPIMDRPRGKELYRLVDSSGVDAVILYTLDRTARDEKVIEYLLFKSHLYDKGVELHYSDTGLGPYTLEGNLVGYIKAHAATEERKKITERSKRGKLAKAQAGRWIGMLVPYGYSKIGSKRDARLEINDAQANIVRQIFKMCAGNDCEPMTLYQIASELNAKAVPTARSARVWRPNTVRYILKNRLYLGELIYSGVVTTHPEPVVVDRALFDAAQARLQHNKAMSKRNRKYDYLLAGRIRCECSRAMYGFRRSIGNKGKTCDYYGCCGSLARGPHAK